MSETNGNGVFDVGWLRDLIVPFEFEFEGHKLSGTWRKYATTTPAWGQRVREEQAKRLERYAQLLEELRTAKGRAATKLMTEKEQLDDAYQRAQYSWLTDAVVTWNAVDQGQPLPIESMKMDGFPLPFLTALGKHLEDSRTDKNPTSSDSSNGA